MNTVINRLRGGIVVSCQAETNAPTDSTAMMIAFAQSAQMGGAVGLRADGTEHISALRAHIPLPIIGIQKRYDADGNVLITTHPADIPPIINAGAEIIAFDASSARDDDTINAVIRTIHGNGALALADLRTFDDAARAVNAGVDALATTLSVFDLPEYQPDIDLIARLYDAYDLPIIAEGNFWAPEQVRQAIEAGAHAVVIGSAITRPWRITEYFVSATK